MRVARARKSEIVPCFGGGVGDDDAECGNVCGTEHRSFWVLCLGTTEHGMMVGCEGCTTTTPSISSFAGG